MIDRRLIRRALHRAVRPLLQTLFAATEGMLSSGQSACRFLRPPVPSMPDEPESPKNLLGRHRPHLSELSKETTEEDLWDLEAEEDLGEGAKSAPANSPAPSERQPETQDSGATPKNEPAKAASIPTEPRSMPRSSAASTNSAKSTARPPAEIELDPEDSNTRTTPRSVDPASRPAPPRASRPNGPRPLDPKSLDSPAADVEIEPDEQVPDQPVPNANQDKSSLLGNKRDKGNGNHEKVGLIALAVLFLGLGFWWLASLFSTISTTRLGDDQPDFPAEGEFVTITTAETYWRKPIRDGDRPDVARIETQFIPVLNINIDDSETGIIRVIFRNEQGDFVGDSISQSFANGVFDSNANPATEFPATDGFASSGAFNGYRVGEDRWTVEVFEGPSTDAPGSEFNLLFTAPVSTNRQ